VETYFGGLGKCRWVFPASRSENLLENLDLENREEEETPTYFHDPTVRGQRAAIFRGLYL
jgi:hypothetical protein